MSFDLDGKCRARPVSKPQSGTEARLRHIKEGLPRRPVVISQKRFCAVLQRSQDCKNRRSNELIEEERRYRAYLQEGNEALVKLFTDNISRTQEEKLEELKKHNEELMRKAKESNIESKALDDKIRKERIARAKVILENMKQGPQALHRALVESETLRVRKYHEQLNREFALAEQRQQCLDNMICPEATVLPLAEVNQEKAEENAKRRAKQTKCEILRFVEERRKRKQAEYDQKAIEDIVERERLKCILAKEEAEAAELKKCKREQCIRNLRQCIEDKKKVKLNEQIAEIIDDRRNCVFNVANRYLNRSVLHYIQSTRETNVRQRELRGMEVCRQQQMGKRKESERLNKDCIGLEKAQEEDTARREQNILKLRNERLAAQAEDMKVAAQNARREAESKRFEMALRLKNEEVNFLFGKEQKRNMQHEKDKLRDMLDKQRNECNRRRRDELLQRSKCPEDQFRADDRFFYKQAANIMAECKAAGRPLHPIVKVVEDYKRQHGIDYVQLQKAAKEPLKLRQKAQDVLRYTPLADLKHAEYERKAACQAAKSDDLEDIVANCLTITRLAETERQTRVPQPIAPVECMQHRHLPVRHGTGDTPIKKDCANIDANGELLAVPGNLWNPPAKSGNAKY